MRLTLPVTGSEEVDAVARVLATGNLTQGPVTAEFEDLVRTRVGSEFAYATSSATTGLHMALRGMGVGPGDEVVIPAYSFPATANVVVQLGARPVFVDIDPDTYNMSPEACEGAIGAATRVVMPVHAFGMCADMDPICITARRADVRVLEDAACALGATYFGRKAGSLGDAGVFSFHPRKVITTGEGGMITTSDDQLAEAIRILRTHGSVRGPRYLEFVEAGFNYRLSDILAAIGVAQMQRLDTILATRRDLAADLTRQLSEIEGLTPPQVPEGRTHTYQSFVVLLDSTIDRDAVIDAMRERGIETTLGTYGMHLQPFFRDAYGLRPEDFPNATVAHRQALTLPLHTFLDATDLSRLIETLAEAIASSRTP